MRVYHEATVTLKILDGRDGGLSALPTDPEQREATAYKISHYLGQLRDDRVYVREATAVFHTVQYSNRSAEEPATLLVLAIKQASAASRRDC